MTTLVEFGEWLQGELNKQNMKAADLSKSSRVDKGIISRALSGERMPIPENLRAIAEGLNIPVARIFEAAGYLPPTMPGNKTKDEFNLLFENLSPEDQEEILELMRFKNERHSSQKTTSRGKKSPARSLLIE